MNFESKSDEDVDAANNHHWDEGCPYWRLL